MTCCAIRGAKALRTPPTKCAGRALFDVGDAVCTGRIVVLKRPSFVIVACSKNESRLDGYCFIFLFVSNLTYLRLSSSDGLQKA
jgi:hypothetical protein